MSLLTSGLIILLFIIKNIYFAPSFLLQNAIIIVKYKTHTGAISDRKMLRSD